MQVLYYENVQKCVFLPQKEYEGDQPITCSHLGGDEDQRERDREKGERTKEQVEERNADKMRQKQR